MPDQPRVWNKHKEAGPYPPDAVYVGRPMRFQPDTWVPTNRFRNRHRVPAHAPLVVRLAAIAACEQDILDALAKDPHYLDELRGRHLLCWCAPEPCHADVLLRLANQAPPG